MDLIRKASNEAFEMYSKVPYLRKNKNLSEITKRVSETRDLRIFLCLGPHIEEILLRTQSISADTFLYNFKICVERMERALEDGEKWYAVTNHSRIAAGGGYPGMEKDGHRFYEPGDTSQCNTKSGMFFLLLALHFSNKLLTSLAGIVCTPEQFSMDCTNVDKKIVMFDDMSYTGVQASSTMRKFREGNLFFVCPYMGTGALEQFKGKGVELIYKVVVPKYKDMGLYTTVGMSRECRHKMEAYAIWFHHKIADNISSFPEIYKYSLEDEVVPPYKDSEKYPEYTRLTKELSDMFVFECTGFDEYRGRGGSHVWAVRKEPAAATIAR